MTTPKTLTIALALILLVTIAISPTRAEQAKTLLTPPFSLLDTNNVEHSLSDYRGKVVLLNFWATWCKPCIEELPSMNALRENFSDKPFEIIAINIGESKQLIDAYFAKHSLKLNFPVLLDQDANVANLYQVKPIPATMLIDKDGNFVYGEIGFQDWNSEESRARIENVFAQ